MVVDAKQDRDIDREQRTPKPGEGPSLCLNGVGELLEEPAQPQVFR